MCSNIKLHIFKNPSWTGGKMKLANYFMIGMDGNLYDTRQSEWHKKPALRPGYSGHNRSIDNVLKLKAALREGKYTGVGCYPCYFITSDGCALSFESVLQNFKSVIDSVKNEINDGWRVVAMDVNYEDAELTCDHTGKPIEYAYS